MHGTSMIQNIIFLIIRYETADQISKYCMQCQFYKAIKNDYMQISFHTHVRCRDLLYIIKSA